MDREREETNSSHYVNSRIALWCPICGAPEGKGCSYVKGLRFAGHNSHTIATPEIPAQWEPTKERKDTPRPKGWTPRQWVN